MECPFCGTEMECDPCEELDRLQGELAKEVEQRQLCEECMGEAVNHQILCRKEAEEEAVELRAQVAQALEALRRATAAFWGYWTAAPNEPDKWDALVDAMNEARAAIKEIEAAKPEGGK